MLISFSTAGSGILLVQDHGEIAHIFLPANEAQQVHVGEASQLQIGMAGPRVASTVVQIEPGLLSPDEVRRRSGPSGAALLGITDPSVAIDLKIAPSTLSHLYAGSPVFAQIQIGTTRVLALTPGLNALIGD